MSSIHVDDEIHQLKKAMHEKEKYTMKIEPHDNKLTKDIHDLEQQIQEMKYSLKSSQFEVNQLRQERDLLFNQIQSIQNLHSDSMNRLLNENKNLQNELDYLKTTISIETEVIMKTIHTIRVKLQNDISGEKYSSTNVLLRKLEDSYYRMNGKIDQQSKAMMESNQYLKDQSDHRNSSVDSSILEVCDFLENENAKLESLLSSSNEKLHQFQNEASAIKIIPHYRLALTRLRNQSVGILRELLNEQETNKRLKHQLASAYDELRDTVEELYKHKSSHHSKLTFDETHKEIRLHSDDLTSLPSETLQKLNETIDGLKKKLYKSSWKKTKEVLEQLSYPNDNLG